MDTFKLKWINEDGTKGVKDVDRANLMGLMKHIKETFSNNNFYATKFVGIIPFVDVIEINKRRNEELDTPFIIYTIDGEDELLSIPRANRIIWSILNELSK